MIQTNVLDYLDNIIEKCPDKTAFADDDVCYTFAQTDSISRSIGSFLARRGYVHEPVLLLMRKSPQMVASFFGVIRGGCYYVPLDVEMPKKRIQLIVENCNPRLLICDASTRAMAEEMGFSGEIAVYEEIAESGQDAGKLAEIRRNSIDTDPIYIVFTSGSTGVPKGVCACHRSVIDYVEQLSEVLGFDEDTVFGNQTPLYFDACLKEIFLTLKFGATTYLIPKKYFMFPVRLVEYLNEKKINTLCWVVSALTMISSVGTLEKLVPKYLRLIAFGSEVFPIRQFQLWREALPDVRFFNLYGPTEGTGMCCYYPVTEEPQEVIPIGFPFQNTGILLLKEDNTEAADGEEGEICIQGTSVTLGYYNNMEKTEECFVQNPLNPHYPEIIYRTGDIGKRNDRGELVFVSRKDFQIKHMGHRIELGEIEANVNQIAGVHLCACVYQAEKDKIQLFYTGEKTEAEVFGELKDMLPRYMLPNVTVQLDKMPFTANGKIDRAGLRRQGEEWS